MNILFICKYNRFRSKIAEILFKQYNKNKELKVRSAGIIQGSFPLDKYEVAEAKKKGIILKGKPIGISSKLLKWQDVIVICADDVPSSIFSDNEQYGKKIIVWKIKDNKTDKEREISNIISMIDKKVSEFVGKLR